MTVRKIRNAFIAGFCGTLVHSLLVLVHSRSGPLPGFQPNEDIQRGLSWLVGTEVHTGFVWLLSFVNGAIVWGFVFGQTYRFLPGNNPWLKGVYFGVGAWLAMGLLSPSRSRHLRCQARLGYCAGRAHARDAVGVQRNNEPSLCFPRKGFGGLVISGDKVERAREDQLPLSEPRQAIAWAACG
jgi:hypothetical protein